MRIITGLGVGLSMLTLSVSSGAAIVAQGQTTITDLSYSLADLRPDDGVLPTFKLLTDRPLTRVESLRYYQAEIGYTVLLEDAVQTSRSGTLFNSAVLDTALDNTVRAGDASAVRDATGLSTAVALDSSSTEGAIFNGGSSPWGGHTLSSGVSISGQTWELSAGTELNISALVNMAAQVDAQALEGLRSETLLVRSSTSVNFYFWVETFPANAEVISSPLSYGLTASQLVSPQGSGDSSNAQAERTDSFSYVLRNNGATPLRLNLQLVAYSYADVNLPAAVVPEPSSWGLGIAGLAMALVITRRASRPTLAA